MTPEERRLLSLSSMMTQRVEEIMKKQFGVSYFRLSKEDELRLLTLLGWEIQYKISLDWILMKLVPVWRSRFGKFKRKQAFGTRVSTLVGKKSEEILKEAIAKELPDNIEHWKGLEQNRQWELVRDRGFSKEDWTDARKQIRRYVKACEQERENRRKFSKRMAKRNYRNNPWTE